MPTDDVNSDVLFLIFVIVVIIIVINSFDKLGFQILCGLFHLYIELNFLLQNFLIAKVLIHKDAPIIGHRLLVLVNSALRIFIYRLYLLFVDRNQNWNMDWCDVLPFLKTDVLRQNVALILFSEVGWVERLAFFDELVVNLFLVLFGIESASWSLICST